MNLERYSCNRDKQRAAAAVTFIIALPVLLGFIGVAIDLARFYARKAEMQHIADSAALTGAKRLDGTKEGIDMALSTARGVVTDSQLGNSDRPENVVWLDDAVRFSKKPDLDGQWLSYGQITDANACDMRYVKINTSSLSVGSGNPNLAKVIFAAILPKLSQQSFDLSATAVAGKLLAPVTPVAVCAPTVIDNKKDPNYDVNFGFKPGQSYDLLKVNPAGPSNQAFLVNPLDPGEDHSNRDDHFGPSILRPFICSGNTVLGQISDADLWIKALPTGTGWNVPDWLNSRFGDPDGSKECGASKPTEDEITNHLINIPLLDCTAGLPDGTAPVRAVAIGQFSMSAPASSTAIPVQFKGALKSDVLPSTLFK